MMNRHERMKRYLQATHSEFVAILKKAGDADLPEGTLAGPLKMKTPASRGKQEAGVVSKQTR